MWALAAVAALTMALSFNDAQKAETDESVPARSNWHRCIGFDGKQLCINPNPIGVVVCRTHHQRVFFSWAFEPHQACRLRVDCTWLSYGEYNRSSSEARDALIVFCKLSKFSKELSCANLVIADQLLLNGNFLRWKFSSVDELVFPTTIPRVPINVEVARNFTFQRHPWPLIRPHDFVGLLGGDRGVCGLLRCNKCGSSGTPRLTQSQSDVVNADAGYTYSSTREEKHPERPLGHALLRIKVLAGIGLFLCGLYGVNHTFARGRSINPEAGAKFILLYLLIMFAGCYLIATAMYP